MKNLKQIIAISLFILFSSNSFSQDLKLSAYTTPSAGRSDIGTSLGILLPGAIGDVELGAYYEKNGDLNKDETDDSRSVISKDYTGVYATMFLVGNEKLGFGVNLRGGMYDAQKFVITFAAIAEYYINPNLAMGLSARFISEVPKVEARLSFNLSGGARRRNRQAKYAKVWDQYKNQW